MADQEGKQTEQVEALVRMAQLPKGEVLWENPNFPDSQEEAQGSLLKFFGE